MHTHFLPVLIFRVLRRRILRRGLRQLSLEVAHLRQLRPDYQCFNHDRVVPTWPSVATQGGPGDAHGLQAA
jgi:hypothetical protein